MNKKIYIALLASFMTAATARAQTSRVITDLTGQVPSKMRQEGETILQAELRLEKDYRTDLLAKQALLKDAVVTSSMINGVKHETHTYLWPNTDIIARLEDYKNGKKQGITKYFSELGVEAGRVFYENDRMVGAAGIFRSYYRDETLNPAEELIDYGLYR